MRPVCTGVASRRGNGKSVAATRQASAGIKLVGLLAMLCASGAAFSQEFPGGPLTNLEFYDELSPLEQRAALVSQITFNVLDNACNNQDIACTDAMFAVLGSVGMLMTTAAELDSGGQTSMTGLGLDAEGLGEALRWAAPEELLRQG